MSMKTRRRRPVTSRTPSTSTRMTSTTLIGVRIDYNRMDDDLEEELDAAEYEDFDDAEEESEEEE